MLKLTRFEPEYKYGECDQEPYYPEIRVVAHKVTALVEFKDMGTVILSGDGAVRVRESAADIERMVDEATAVDNDCGLPVSYDFKGRPYLRTNPDD